MKIFMAWGQQVFRWRLDAMESIHCASVAISLGHLHILKLSTCRYCQIVHRAVITMVNIY